MSEIVKGEEAKKKKGKKEGWKGKGQVEARKSPLNCGIRDDYYNRVRFVTVSNQYV